MEEYEQLLNEAYEKVKPIKSSSGERFEVPKANIQVIGNKTYVENFLQICNYLRRQPEHVMKFLSKELATFSKIENERLMLNRKLQISHVNDKINLYINAFVTCKECKKPDTALIKQDGLMFIHCLACGAKHSLGRL